MAFYIGRGFPKIFVSTLRENRYNKISVVHVSSQVLAVAPKSRNKGKARKPQLSKKLRLEFEKYKGQYPIISCQRTEFNFYKGMTYDKLEPVPLASQSWLHRKSCGDSFSLYKDCPKPHELVHFGNIPIVKKNEDNFAEEQTHHHSNFEDLGISPQIVEALRLMEVSTPADIQVAAIPSVLKGKNTVISAHTGCGKTLAFLLPLVQQVLQRNREVGLEAPFNSPKALIIAPTRELAAQIKDVLSELTKELPVNCRLLVGGGKMDKSLNEVDILVGSLGVVWKHVALGAYKLKNLIHVVLDEADALVDDKNYERVIRLFNYILVRDKPNTKGVEFSHGCQLTLVSATIPTNLSRTFSDIVQVEDMERITTSTLHHVPTNVPQTFLRVGSPNKAKALLDLVTPDHNKKTPVIIFSNKGSTADWVSLQLNDMGIPCRNLTSNVPKALRKNLFKAFQDGEFNVLSTTDIGATGLDTVRVEHVINFEFPLYMALYVHRVGRVGRIGSSDKCHVTNIISHPREILLVQKIEMAVRTYGALENVNINVPGIIAHRHGEERF